MTAAENLETIARAVLACWPLAVGAIVALAVERGLR